METKRTVTEIVLLLLTALATLIVSVFSAIRWYNDDITIAIIDLIISITMAILCLYIFKTRKVDVTKLLFAIFLVIACTASIAIKGLLQVYWLYPIIITMYYLIPPKSATALCLLLITTTSFIISIETDLINVLTILLTTLMTSTFSFIMFRSYERKILDFEALATIDQLTSTGNRRALDKRLADVIASQHRKTYDMCLILIDLDDFKKINDNYGHAVGDNVLVTTCNLIKQHTRVLDSLYRFGGDELVVMPLNMDLKSAKQVAEKIRCIIENHVYDCDIKITLSIGVAEYQPDDTPEKWIGRADTLLYKAKDAGRNQVY
jgi:diguanylate cyclase (GGDEF)-like protein